MDRCDYCNIELYMNICPYCNIEKLFEETKKIRVPRFVELELFIYCLASEKMEQTYSLIRKKRNYKKASWIFLAPDEFIKEYVTQLWLLKENIHKDCIEYKSGYNLNIYNEILSKLKKYYYGKELAKHYFDPRTEGEYKEKFQYFDKIMRNILVIIQKHWGNLKKCNKCLTYSDRDFLIKENGKLLCLGCVSSFRICDFGPCNKKSVGLFQYKNRYSYLCNEHYDVAKKRGFDWKPSTLKNKPEIIYNDEGEFTYIY